MTAPQRGQAPSHKRRASPRREYPGRKLFRGVTRKSDPLRVEDLGDVELLAYFLPRAAAAGVVERLGPAGLANYLQLSEGGPRALLGIPGVDEATAARLLALWELAARISAPYK